MWGILVAVSCLDPATFGGVPDDGRSDTAAFQRAIDEGIAKNLPVCVSPGIWLLDRPKRQLGSLMITGGPLVITGRDPKRRPVLRMSGDGNRGHWGMIQLRGAHGIVLRDLILDGLAAHNTEEQTHLIEVGPDSKDIAIANLELGPMRRPTQPVGAGLGGDCIRLLGNPGHEVERVTIASSLFVDCDRSAIGLQRSLREIVMASLVIRGTGDTPIDFEPTGAGAIEDVVMIDLDIQRAPNAQGAWSVTIGGVGRDLASHIVLARSKLGAGGVGMINVADVEIVDNTITHHAGVEGVISIMRRGSGIRIARNTITRPSLTPAGPIVRATNNNGYSPDSLLIEDNVLRQCTSSPVVYSASARGLVVRRNTIAYTGADARMGIVVAEARAADVGEIQIVDNTIRGRSPLLIAGARGHTFGTIDIQRNVTESSSDPLRCDGAGTAFRSITIDTSLAARHGCEAMPIKRNRRAP